MRIRIPGPTVKNGEDGTEPLASRLRGAEDIQVAEARRSEVGGAMDVEVKIPWAPVEG